jgi:Ca-activated chloride channel family protein
VKFEYAWMLNLLLIIPGIVFLLVIENRKKKKALALFAQPHLLPVLTEIKKKSSIFFKGFFFILSIAFFIVALSGPKWGSHYQDVQRKGVDIIFLLDASKSMLAQDVKPDRMERAKREINDFLRVAEGDRVGLVVFSGDAFVQCPLTLDYAAISMFVNSINTDTVPIKGTDMGRGLSVCLDAFDYTYATDKVIIMITDGEDNEQKGSNQAVKANDKQVKIFVYGIGEPEGSPIPIETGGFEKDDKGNLVLSKLNEDNLIKIANTADGRYVRSVTGDLDLDRLYFDGIRKKTKARELQSDKIKVYEERFPLFIAFGLFFLMLEAIVDINYKNKGKFLGVFIFCLMLIPIKYAFAVESGESFYQKGLFKEAEEAFLKEDMETPKDVRKRYNRGCASFKNSNFNGATAAFESVLRRTDKKNIKFNAAFNLASSHYMNGNYKDAASYFKEALKLNPEDEDARHNYELALKTLEASEKKQKEQGDTQNKEQQNKEQPNKDNTEQKKPNEKTSEDGQQQSNDKGPQEDKDNKDEQKEGNEDNKQDQDNQKSEPDQNSNRENKSETDGSNLKSDNAPKDSGQDKTRASDLGSDEKNITANEAQAFIDNVTEDPSEINKFRFKGRNVYPQSKKDW